MTIARERVLALTSVSAALDKRAYPLKPHQGAARDLQTRRAEDDVAQHRVDVAPGPAEAVDAAMRRERTRR